MNQSLTATNQNANDSYHDAKTTVRHAFSKNGALSIGGIAIAEIAVLGAAGYVLWKNRTQIESLLEKGGVQVPSILKADMNELVATSAAFIAKSKRAFAEAEGHSFQSEPKETSTGSNNSFSMNSGSSFNSSKPSTTASASTAQFASKDSQAAKKSSSTIHDA